MIEIKDTGDLIRKGLAAFKVCYDCDYCIPISHDCENEHHPKIKFEKDELKTLRLICNKFEKKKRMFDPNSW